MIAGHGDRVMASGTVRLVARSGVMTRASLLCAVLVVAALLAGCGGDGPLSDDPHGREACDLLVKSVELEHDDQVGLKIGMLMEAGKEAELATTESIRDALDPIEGLEDLPIVNARDLTAACLSAGVDVPDE